MLHFSILPVRPFAIALALLMAAAASAATKHFPERRSQCLQCHGNNGVSRTPETPSLGGIPEFYALVQLVEFRDGNRNSEIMSEVVKGMTDDDLRAAAAFVANQPRPPVPTKAGDPDRMRRGAILAIKHRCNLCHGKQFLGGDQMPPLRHQREDYLLKAMRDYKSQRRIGDRAAMVEIVTPLSAQNMVDLAHYLAHVRN